MKLSGLVFAVAAAFMLVPDAFASDLNPTSATAALPFVSPIFSDNMVLQRGKKNALWGWSESGDKVSVQIGGKTATAIAGKDRRWQVMIDPPAVGGPYVVKISGRESVELHNVLVGDVWLCAGQSNMLVPLRFARNGAEEIKAADAPDIRVFSVAQHAAYRPADTVEGKWMAVSPQTADKVSAVAYYFARKVQKETHVPIGLVVAAVGGTPAESWASTAALRPLKDFDIPLTEMQRLAVPGAPEYGNYVMHWYDAYDLGLKGKWFAPDLADSDWNPVEIPGGFAELGVPTNPALVWFRKEIVLPDPLPAGMALAFLGSIERMDTLYINGTEIGGSAWVENPRVYPIREGVLKPGRNTIALRVLKSKPDGGFLAKPDVLRLMLGDKSSIPLAGSWKAKLSVDGSPPQPLPLAYENWPVMPTVLYEGMLKPLTPMAITGALWYQGEQNSERGYQYRRILPAMIASWRKAFAQGDFPFYIVSLPAYKQRSAEPVDGDEWAETRESQAVAAARIPNSCLAVTIDTGDADNIHPQEKQPVGERLALCALANHYGQKVVASGPTVSGVERRTGAIRIRLTHTEGGLVTKGSKLEEFAVAGDDRKWHWAEARIEGDSVIVSSPAVPNPKQVRYAWQSNPAATLFNAAGLPAAPFRTDTWPGMTEKHRPY